MEPVNLRVEATRLLRSVESRPLAEAIGMQRAAEQMLRMADLIDRGPIVSEQPTGRRVLTPKY